MAENLELMKEDAKKNLAEFQIGLKELGEDLRLGDLRNDVRGAVEDVKQSTQQGLKTFGNAAKNAAIWLQTMGRGMDGGLIIVRFGF